MKRSTFINNMSHYGDILAIPFFFLLSLYFYNIQVKTTTEYILLFFSITGLFADILFTYTHFFQLTYLKKPSHNISRMNLLRFFSLLLVYKPRNLKPEDIPHCKDCIYYQSYPLLPERYELGRCKKFVHPNAFTGDIVYNYADLTRKNDSQCSTNGRHFESRLPQLRGDPVSPQLRSRV